MKRIIELENRIRDCQLIGIAIKMDCYAENAVQEKLISIEFRELNGSVFLVKLIHPLQLDYFEDNFSGQHIDSVKCLSAENKIQISLDPFDEKIDKITNDDNLKIICLDYDIID